MRKILFVIPSLEYSGVAGQVAMLAKGLPRGHFELRVCALGEAGPAAGQFRAAGIRVDALGPGRLLHLTSLWRLRRLVRDFCPDAIHTWGRVPLRAVALAAGRRESRLLASGLFPPHLGDLGRLDRWLLRGVDLVVARGQAEGERCRRLPLPSDKVVVVPPGVEMPCAERAEGSEDGSSISAHRAQRRVVCAGRLEPHKGFRDAIWAVDILQFIYDNLLLVLIGTGPDQERLERFAEATGAGCRVRFAGHQADLTRDLASADVVWIPSLRGAGVNVALEAMALARVVVASRLPGLAEVVADGETGMLVTPGNKVELARRTRLLLDDPARCRRMGEAGRARAARHFAAAEMVRRFAALYSESRPAA